VPLWDRVGVREDGSLYDRGRPSRLGLNAKTQGTQADLLKVAMHRLLHWGWLWSFRFALHDELVLEVPEPMAEFARALLEAAMTITYRGVTIRCEAVIEGRTWLPQPREFDAIDLPDLDEEDAIA
jgi:DNA polymerase I-like protein with 3'-5' exonuclease and polymerase domains